MIEPQQVLFAAAGPSASLGWGQPRQQSVLVVGAGGALGQAVLEQLLGSRRWARVAAVVHQPMRVAMRGLVVVHNQEIELQALGAETALVVLDRVRQNHHREPAFVMPVPQDLPQWAARLHRAGVRRLVVVVPHHAALLPMALQQGLATLDEAAVAALGFEQLVFMRMAQNGADGDPSGGAPSSGWRSTLQRLADWMLSQMQWMAPQREQAVRPETVAKVAAALVLQLRHAPPATRVWPAQWTWHAAQQRDVGSTAQAWLEGAPMPQGPARPKMRL